MSVVALPYEVVAVIPDTPEWMEERRKSVGASEVAAVMGMSKWATPLDTYRSKHGVDRDFDPLLGWIGHESEAIIHRWVEQHSGLGVKLAPGFMARSVEWPFLHASLDRITATDDWDIYQLKTAHQYTSHHWDEGIPDEYRVQVQAEMAVTGKPRAAVVVWIGGREFRIFWEPRNDQFINDHLVPDVREFWERVQAGDPPPPATVGEIQDVWPSQESLEVDLTDTAMETLDRITVLNSDIKAQTEERDALKVALAPFVQGAEVLNFQGRKVATWRSQKGRVGFDQEALAADHPEIVEKYTRIGKPFKVLRAVKQKESK